MEAPKSSKALFTADVYVDTHYSKKNGRTFNYRTGQIIYNPRVRALEQSLVLQLQQRARDIHFGDPIDFPVHLLCILQLSNFYTQKGKVNKRAGDLSNILQGVEDSLQKAGIISDDGLIVALTATKLQGPNHISLAVIKADE